MKHVVTLALLAAVAACSEAPPPPKPAAQAEAPKPPAPPVAAAAPEAPKAPEPPKPDPNKELATRVKQALEAPESKLPSGAIDVTASEGKVSLWGAVASEAQRRRAASRAGKIEGVKGVDNQLKVVKGS